MADYINLQKEEYTELQTKLTALHEDILESEEKIRTDILSLVKIDGGFYVDAISQKTDYLLQKINDGPMDQMSTCFDQTEKGLEGFLNQIVEIDTAYI